MTDLTCAKRIALVSGFWGQNIGNAFFNLGGKWILEQAFPEARVEFVQDQPGYRTFHRKSSGNPARDVGLLKYLDVDAIVLQGPMLTRTFPALWDETFRALTRRGTKIILLSAAFFEYSEEEIAISRRFLEAYPPAVMVTRDRQTYDALKDTVPLIHDGIDSAFFVPKVYAPFDLTLSPYVTVNFDRYPEPEFRVSDRADAGQFGNGSFRALGSYWTYESPKIQSKFSEAGQWQAYLGALIDRRKLPGSMAGYKVVRPEHRFNPHVPWKIYSQSNAFASDEPFSYLTLYKGTSLTLSDRVHACVATLAYGNPAMLFSPTPRMALFDRLGVGDLRRRPVELDAVLLGTERQAEIEFLRGVAGSIF